MGISRHWVLLLWVLLPEPRETTPVHNVPSTHLPAFTRSRQEEIPGEHIHEGYINGEESVANPQMSVLEEDAPGDNTREGGYVNGKGRTHKPQIALMGVIGSSIQEDVPGDHIRGGGSVSRGKGSTHKPQLSMLKAATGSSTQEDVPGGHTRGRGYVNGNEAHKHQLSEFQASTFRNIKEAISGDNSGGGVATNGKESTHKGQMSVLEATIVNSTQEDIPGDKPMRRGNVNEEDSIKNHQRPILQTITHISTHETASGDNTRKGGVNENGSLYKPPMYLFQVVFSSSTQLAMLIDNKNDNGDVKYSVYNNMTGFQEILHEISGGSIDAPLLIPTHVPAQCTPGYKIVHGICREIIDRSQ